MNRPMDSFLMIYEFFSFPSGNVLGHVNEWNGWLATLVVFFQETQCFVTPMLSKFNSSLQKVVK